MGGRGIARGGTDEWLLHGNVWLLYGMSWLWVIARLSLSVDWGNCCLSESGWRMVMQSAQRWMGEEVGRYRSHHSCRCLYQVECCLWPCVFGFKCVWMCIFPSLYMCLFVLVGSKQYSLSCPLMLPLMHVVRSEPQVVQMCMHEEFIWACVKVNSVCINV